MRHKISLTRNVEKARKALANNDAEALAAVMHSMKSSSRQFGAIQLGQISENIEKSALENDLAAVQSIFSQLVSMHKDIMILMEAEVNKSFDLQ